MKQKAAIISLLFCFIAPLLATYSYLQLERLQIKKGIKNQIIEGIDKNELVKLQFTIEESEIELDWEHSKEFEYKDQMYDVVESKTYGDSIYYWCWWDNEETALHKKLDQLLAKVLGNSASRNEKEDKLLEFYKNLYCQENTDHKPIEITYKVIKPVSNDHSVSLDFKPPVPPPILFI